MTLIKFASAAVLDARMAPRGGGLVKDAHRHEFEYEPRPGFLYVRSRAISSRTNDNFDHFPAEEIKKAYRTFIGKPVFVNHHNDNHRRARGVIVDAALHEDTNPDGSPDTWTEVLMEVDAVRFPKLAQAILAGEIDRTSMGTDVQFSVCSVCNNKAATPLEYCDHIPRMKGKKFRRRTASGGHEDVLVYEKCYGLGFFENSLLVEEPADPTAFFLGVDARGVEGMKATASRREALSGEDLAFRDLLSHDDELRDTLPPAWVNPQHHQPVKPWGVQSMRTTALGETMAPAEVDTLRDESCPVCGEHDSYDGDKCSVCQFIKPPDEFLDPDLEKAKQVDLRQDQNAEEGLAAQDGAPDPDAAQAGPGQDGADPAKPWLSKELPVGGPDPAADGAGGKPWEQKERPKDDAAAAPESTEDTEGQGQPWKQKTRRKSARATTQKENSMRTALQALAEQQQIINAQGRRIAVLEQGINLIAKAAGIDTHPRMAALLKRAADENPAQPEGWANPAGNGGGSEAPTESTDQAATPSNKDNVESTGEAPGTDVSPDATTSLDSTETVLDDGLDLNEQDVTKPVAGTDNLGKGEPGAANTNRIETEVRVGDPNKPDVAFAETGWTAAKQPTEGRTIASLRLARLRIEAGIETGTDDLDLGTAIAASEATDEAIQTEIDTLAKVVTAKRASANQQRQTVARNLVPRTAGQAQRTVPSFTAEPQLPIQTVASGPSDDEFAFE